MSERWPRPSQDRHHSEESPATHAEIDQAERRLGVRFPADYRSYLLGQNGLKGWFGDVYLELYPVSRVVDATEAHETARSFKPDLILLDVVMPKIDGGELAAKIQADHELHNTPIIFLTALVTTAEAKTGLHIQGHPFVAKPINIPELIEAIEGHLPVRTEL